MRPIEGLLLLLPAALAWTACDALLGIEKGVPGAGGGGGVTTATTVGPGGTGGDGGAGGMPPEDVPFLDGYARRRAVTIHGQELLDPLTDFPWPIRTVDTTLIGNLDEGGDDLRFTTGDGVTVLPHEIDLLEDDVLLAWVLLSEVPREQHTIYVYYDNGSAPNEEDPQTVWKDFQAVWHMSTDLTLGVSPVAIDSTGRGNDSMTPPIAEAPSRIDTPLGSGYRYDGVDDSVAVPPDLSLDVGGDSFSLSAFVFVVAPNQNQAFFLMHGSNGVPGYGMRAGADTWFLRLHDGMDPFNTNFGGFTTLGNAWHHLVAVVDEPDGTVMTYVDGVQVDTQPLTIDALQNPTLDTYLGHDVNRFTGDVDEVRISRQVRGPAWCNAAFRTVLDADEMYTIGPAELHP